MHMNSPYAEAPKGVRTYKSRIVEEREYARLLSAAIQGQQTAGTSLSSAVWTSQSGQPPQRPQSAGARTSTGLTSADPPSRSPAEPEVAVKPAQPRVLMSSQPLRQSNAAVISSGYGASKVAVPADRERKDLDEVTRRARERAREKRADLALAEYAKLQDQLKKHERKEQWSQKQLAHLSQQLAQMRSLLVSVSEQRDAAYDAAEIASEEAQVTAAEATALRDENFRLRTEVAELLQIPMDLRPMMASLVLKETRAGAGGDQGDFQPAQVWRLIQPGGRGRGVLG